MSKKKAEEKVPLSKRIFKDTVFEKKSPWQMFLDLVDRMKGRKTYYLPFTRRVLFNAKKNSIIDRNRKVANSNIVNS